MIELSELIELSEPVELSELIELSELTESFGTRSRPPINVARGLGLFKRWMTFSIDR